MTGWVDSPSELVAWEVWAAGVLTGITAPLDSTNEDTLWTWSNAESGANVMRWNNPLNSGWYMPGAIAMNSIPIWAYASIQDGISATVQTLLNGPGWPAPPPPFYYPVILANLRASVPRAQWGNACANLNTWGTGCGWLTATYGPAPGNLTGDLVTTQAEFDAFVQNNPQLGGGGYAARLVYATGTTYHPGQPNLETSARLQEILAAVKAIPAPTVTVDNTAVLAAIADLKLHPTVASDPVLLGKVSAIEANLNAPRPPA